jgi:hypothetical protein
MRKQFHDAFDDSPNFWRKILLHGNRILSLPVVSKDLQGGFV